MKLEDFISSIEKEKYTIALDFDGVIHNDSEGFYDGTIYGNPIEGTKSALELLSSKYKLVIYSCKSNPDRPLINNKTGTELIWEWLEHHNLKQYISYVVWGKPNAFIYVDDKGLRFSNWDKTLSEINSITNE